MLDQEVLVEMYGSVIHHVLHKQGVHKQQDEYGDYYNELYIKLVDLASKFRGNALDEAERGRFVGYAKPALTRYLWWLLKRDSYRKLEVLTDGSEYEFGHVYQASELSLVEYMADAERVLSTEEYEFFKVAADTRWTVTEKARMLGISRKGYYGKFREIIHNLRLAFNCDVWYI